MKYFSIILLTITTAFGVSIQVGDTFWEYQQSTFQSFYMYESIEVDGMVVEETDVVGAFHILKYLNLLILRY